MKRRWLSVLFALVTVNLSAQTKLLIDTTGNNLPFAVTMNDTLTLNLVINALDGQGQPTAYNGTVILNYITNNMQTLQIPPVAFDSAVMSIAPVTGGNITTEIQVQSPNFSVGGNVIIVWPTYHGPNPMYDSLIIDISVNPLTLDEKEYADILVVYPNPSAENFVITAPESGIQKVEILNLAGQTMYTNAYPEKQAQLLFDISGYSPGNYTVRIWLADGRMKIARLVVQ